MSRFLILSIIAGIVGAVVAERKGRSWPLWAFLCAFFPFSIVVILLLPPVPGRGRSRQCPHCGEALPQGQTSCGRCGRELAIELRECPRCGSYAPKGEPCPECRNSGT
jgi:hypothetical protein